MALAMVEDVEVGKHEAFSRIVTVGPELAAAWLQKNSSNRPVNSPRVEHYARQMRDGDWALNGESLKFDTSGRLVDGQHRLEAVVRSGVTVQTYVVFDLSPEAFDTIDTGFGRTASDVFSMRGEVNTSQLAGAAHLLWRYEQGIWHRGGPPNPSHRDLEQVLALNPGLRASVAPGRHAGTLLRPSMAVCLHYLFSKRDPTLADLFFDGLASGVELQHTDPVRVLRERLLQNRASKARLGQRDLIALTVKAWNYTRAGRSISNLRWRSVGDKAEPFPDVE